MNHELGLAAELPRDFSDQTKRGSTLIFAPSARADLRG